MSMIGKAYHAFEAMKAPHLVPIEHEVSSSDRFEGKVALVAGGTGGIGSAIASRLAEGGCEVVIGGRDSQRLTSVAETLGVHGAVVDYDDPDGLDEQIGKVAQEHGGLDLFVSSVGTHTAGVNFWSMTSKEFDRVMDVNLRGTFFACRAAAKAMLARGGVAHGLGGGILLIGSSRGFEPAWSPYGISKWGVRGMTLGLAKQLAEHGIRVNAIAPGATATTLVGFEEGDSLSAPENAFWRYITPEEVAGLACYLLSDSAAMITGETISIAGGRGAFDVR